MLLSSQPLSESVVVANPRAGMTGPTMELPRARPNAVVVTEPGEVGSRSAEVPGGHAAVPTSGACPA
jgi:hypothetical protein